VSAARRRALVCLLVRLDALRVAADLIRLDLDDARRVGHDSGLPHP
jgi:hypothetical protein